MMKGKDSGIFFQTRLTTMRPKCSYFPLQNRTAIVNSLLPDIMPRLHVLEASQQCYYTALQIHSQVSWIAS